MSSPPINPPDTRWYEITSECVECGTIVHEEGRTDWPWVTIGCPECGHHWDIGEEQ